MSRISDFPDWAKRNCLCDDSCTHFGDCCPDSKRFEPNQQRSAGARFSCLHLRQYNFNWIVNKCPKDWNDPEVAQACEIEPAEWQIHLDPISHMPVTSQVTGVTYRNLNCATCHQDVPGTRVNSQSPLLRFWYELVFFIIGYMAVPCCICIQLNTARFHFDSFSPFFFKYRQESEIGMQLDLGWKHNSQHDQ